MNRIPRVTTVEEVRNRYFKESSVPLMSGLPLPKDSDGKVRDKRFVNCDFHPNCDSVEFVDCEFVHCSGQEYLKVGTEY